MLQLDVDRCLRSLEACLPQHVYIYNFWASRTPTTWPLVWISLSREAKAAFMCSLFRSLEFGRLIMICEIFCHYQELTLAIIIHHSRDDTADALEVPLRRPPYAAPHRLLTHTCMQIKLHSLCSSLPKAHAGAAQPQQVNRTVVFPRHYQPARLPVAVVAGALASGCTVRIA